MTEQTRGVLLARLLTTPFTIEDARRREHDGGWDWPG